MGSLHQDIAAQNLLDPEEFRQQGHMMVEFIADYYRNVEKYPVLSQVSPGYLRGRLPESAPTNAESQDSILRDIRDHIIPGLTHWQSPNFFAYFPGSTSAPGILGEMLAAAFNVVGFSWIASPAATELEMIVMDWMGKLLSLPEAFLFKGGGGGVLQGTTCEAMLCTLIAARDKALRTAGRDRICDLVVYCSDQTHCSLKKAAQIAGILPDNVRVLPTSSSDAFALSPDVLRAAMAADVAALRVPLYLCVTVGTTSSTAVDPVRGLSTAAAEHGVWVHVDAAYAGCACICPEFRHFLDGVEAVDSFSFNAHKWLFATLDCCCLWVKQPQHLVDALATNPEYLRNEATELKKVVDFKDWQIALSRRFRSLKLWMVLRSYGTANLRAFVRNHVRLAELFEALVRKDERFVVAAPRTFALVCFRMLPPPAVGSGGGLKKANQINRRLLEAVNATGKVYMTHAVLGGVYVIRANVGASLSEERHVRAAWAVVQEQAEALTSAIGRG